VISAIEIFNDTMYITTTNFSGGQLWRSGDAVNFTNITDDAFGEGPSVNELRKPVVANGKFWLTGYTEITLSTGSPVWRSDDGLNWVQSNTNGFGDTLNNGQNAVVVGFQNYTYFGGPNYTTGGQIWRTEITTEITDPSAYNCQAILAPNPFSDFAFLHIDKNCSKITNVNIYDITGRLIQKVEDVHTDEIIIEKNKMKPGVYFYRLKT